METTIVQLGICSGYIGIPIPLITDIGSPNSVYLGLVPLCGLLGFGQEVVVDRLKRKYMSLMLKLKNTSLALAVPTCPDALLSFEGHWVNMLWRLGFTAAHGAATSPTPSPHVTSVEGI